MPFFKPSSVSDMEVFGFGSFLSLCLAVWLHQNVDVVLNTPSSSIKVFITLLYSFISGNVAFHSVVTKYRTQPFITINKPSKKKKKNLRPNYPLDNFLHLAYKGSALALLESRSHTCIILVVEFSALYGPFMI